MSCKKKKCRAKKKGCFIGRAKKKKCNAKKIFWQKFFALQVFLFPQFFQYFTGLFLTLKILFFLKNYIKIESLILEILYHL
jgi:hypothetical protein